MNSFGCHPWQTSEGVDTAILESQRTLEGKVWGQAGVLPGDMESLSTSMAVTGHAGSRGCLALPALLLTDVTGLQDTEQSSPPPFYPKGPFSSILSP